MDRKESYYVYTTRAYHAASGTIRSIILLVLLTRSSFTRSRDGSKIPNICHLSGRYVYLDSTYMQDRPARVFVQAAGLTGQGGSFGGPACFGENATKTRGGAA